MVIGFALPKERAIEIYLVASPEHFLIRHLTYCLMAQIDHPIHSMCTDPEHDILFVGGGGGKGHSGVPNTIKVCKLEDGKINLIDTIQCEDAVTGLDYSRGKKSSIVASIGPEICLIDPKTKKIFASFDTKMTHCFCRSLKFSSNGQQLVSIDGDDILRLFTIPQLTQIAQDSNHKYARAAFIQIGGKEYIVAAGVGRVVLLKPDKTLKIVAKSEELGRIHPRGLAIDGTCIYVAGAEPAGKSSTIFKLEVINGKLALVKKITPKTNGLIFALGVNEKHVNAVTGGGDILLFTKQLSMARQVSRQHMMPPTSTCTLGDFVVSGGLDNLIWLTPNAGESNKIMRCAYLIVILAIIIGLFFDFRENDRECYNTLRLLFRNLNFEHREIQ